MKGYVFLGDKEIDFVEKPTPTPGPGEALIKEKTSALCGSDLHVYRAPKAYRSSCTHTFTGHEPVGEVIAVGEGVQWPKVGDRVVGYHALGCGECRYCQTREFKKCPHNFIAPPDDPERVAMMENRDGSNADHFVAKSGQLLPLPDDFSYEDGSVLSCNFGTAWSAIKTGSCFPGGTIALWGLGPVGLNIVLIAKKLGMRVIGIDLSSARCDFARDAGADEVIDGSQTDAVEQLLSLTGGEGADTVIDTTGAGPVHERLVEATRLGGHIVLVGMGHETSVGPVPAIILRQVTIHGSWIYDIADWWPMLEFVRQHEIDLMSCVEEVVPISQFPEKIEKADKGECGKIIFRWD